MLIDRQKLIDLIYQGMQTDGAHHKQWALYQIAKMIMTEDELKSFRVWFDDEVDEGIPP